MSQSSIVAGAVFIAFVVYVTTKGELPAYLGFAGIGAGTAQTASQASSVGDMIGSAIAGANQAGVAGGLLGGLAIP